MSESSNTDSGSVGNSANPGQHSEPENSHSDGTNVQSVSSLPILGGSNYVDVSQFPPGTAYLGGDMDKDNVYKNRYVHNNSGMFIPNNFAHGVNGSQFPLNNALPIDIEKQYQQQRAPPPLQHGSMISNTSGSSGNVNNMVYLSGIGQQVHSSNNAMPRLNQLPLNNNNGLMLSHSQHNSSGPNLLSNSGPNSTFSGGNGAPAPQSNNNQQQHYSSVQAESYRPSTHPKPKPWHNVTNYEPRRIDMIQRIYIILTKQALPDGPPVKWNQKFFQMAKKLENSLFEGADSFEEYFDPNTIRPRLYRFAALNKAGANSAASSKQRPNSNAASESSAQIQLQSQRSPQATSVPVQQQSNPLPNVPQGGQPQPQLHGDYLQQPFRSNTPTSHNYPMGNTDAGSSGINDSDGAHGLPRNDSSNNMELSDALNSSNVHQPAKFINLNQINPLIGGSGSRKANDGSSAIGVVTQPQRQSVAESKKTPAVDGQQPATAAVSRSSAVHSDEHRRQVLKQQQQRLLLLRHASKCPHDNNRCPVTPHCSSMKSLWKHIMSCKDQECKVPHCVSSRYVLSHYSKCKEQNCPVCGPVREAIRRNHERSQSLITASTKKVEAEKEKKAPPAKQPKAPPQDVAPAAKKYKASAARQQKQEQAQAAAAAAPSAPVVKKLDPISCPLYCFTSEQINSHIKNMHEGVRLSSSGIKQMCLPIIDALFSVNHVYSIFGVPVDPIALGLDCYFEIVKQPMDLGTVRKRLETSFYRNLTSFADDVRLTFSNAMKYNAKSTDVYALSKAALKDFETRYKAVVTKHEQELALSQGTHDACLLCGEKNMRFEPPVYYCNGKCGLKIRRGSTFYANANNSYHWCNACFNDLGAEQPILLPDCTLRKSDISGNKKKHAEESDEPWVACDTCEGWVHQLCALFNGRRNIGDTLSYMCPKCVLNKRAKEGTNAISTDKKMKASDLPHTNMSLFLDHRINEKLQQNYQETSERLGIPIDQVEKCPPITLRQIASYDKNQQVRDGMCDRYKDKNYPTEYPCRVKCVLLFQNIDGQDVLLFGMYVYEYGHKSPKQNHRSVYVSYLDSVHYLRPRQYRTLVYHEILVSYLEYVKARGFHSAYIWACPPLKGDDYILYCHPSDQKNPKDDRLRKWYSDVLVAAKDRGIICEISDLYTELFADVKNDCSILPYFEGDYWVNEAEVIIKDLKSTNSKGGRGKNHIVLSNLPVEEEKDESKSKRKSKSKTKKSNVLVVPPPVAPPAAASSSTAVERDPVMAKLAGIIETMKEAFFVVRLHPKEYADQCWNNRVEELETETKGQDRNISESDKVAKLQAEALSDKSSSAVMSVAAPTASSSSTNTAGGLKDAGAETAPRNTLKRERTEANMTTGDCEFTRVESEGEVITQQQANDDAEAETLKDMGLEEVEEGAASEGIAESKMKVEVKVEPSSTSESSDVVVVEKEESSSSVQLGEGVDISPVETASLNKNTNSSSSGAYCGDCEPKIRMSTASVAVRALSRSISLVCAMNAFGVNSLEASSLSLGVNQLKEEGGQIESKEEAALEPTGESQKALLAVLKAKYEKDDTEDVDDTQESEHFDTRQSFLNLCQGNHYQFDQLRRAKHTSMMVLYHLHNPDAPKFVPNCNRCHADILVGFRYRCDTCELDYCAMCLSSFGKSIHPHNLRSIATSSTAPPQQLTEAQRKERQKSMQLHLQLLQHSSNCHDKACVSKSCHKMKEFLRHGETCTVTLKRGCGICKRVNTLLQLHARSCRLDKCPVQNCLAIRENIRSMAMRQQIMDDRRRAMMNEMYNRPGQEGSSEEQQA